VFDVTYQGKTTAGFVMSWPGRHNVENALGATAACMMYGIPVAEIKAAIAAFTGVLRRFDYQLRTNEVVFIDDYAHHPEELKATINSVKELYPNDKILGIFQPHLYTRTRDFAEGFGTSLSLLDEILLLDIYPARELPIPGVTSEMILNLITTPSKSVVIKDKLIEKVLTSDARVILTLGAGDIDQLVAPLKNALMSKHQITVAG
jgi:UDP-N-acetylmuramate--alanine ligase